MLINDALKHSNAWDGQLPAPANACYIRTGYCFVSFTTPEAATSALAFDGMPFGGSELRIRRPHEYQSATPDQPRGPRAGSGGISSLVPDSPNKIFIGGIPSHMTEQDVQAILSPFGQLQAFNLVRDTTTRVSRGFAFCEFQDVSVTDYVCQTLNGQKLHEKTLSVQRAQQPAGGIVTAGGPFTGGPVLGMAGHGVDANGSHDSSDADIVRNLLTLATPMQEAMASVSVLACTLRTTSRVVLFLNMASIESLRDDDFYHDLVIDVHEVCSAFGKVCSIVIPRITNTNSGKNRPPPGSVGRVFVEFADLQAAATALEHLGGTLYDFRKVIALFYSESKYAEGRYDS